MALKMIFICTVIFAMLLPFIGFVMVHDYLAVGLLFCLGLFRFVFCIAHTHYIEREKTPSCFLRTCVCYDIKNRVAP